MDSFYQIAFVGFEDALERDIRNSSCLRYGNCEHSWDVGLLDAACRNAELSELGAKSWHETGKDRSNYSSEMVVGLTRTYSYNWWEFAKSKNTTTPRQYETDAHTEYANEDVGSPSTY